jgi:hypothetical protein
LLIVLSTAYSSIVVEINGEVSNLLSALGTAVTLGTALWREVATLPTLVTAVGYKGWLALRGRDANGGYHGAVEEL